MRNIFDERFETKRFFLPWNDIKWTEEVKIERKCSSEKCRFFPIHPWSKMKMDSNSSLSTLPFEFWSNKPSNVAKITAELISEPSLAKIGLINWTNSSKGIWFNSKSLKFSLHSTRTGQISKKNPLLFDRTWHCALRNWSSVNLNR